MKKLTLIFSILLFVFPLMSQIEVDDAQLFGSSRSVAPKKATSVTDFGEISDSVSIEKLNFKNQELKSVNLKAAVLPQGISVMFPQNFVGPQTEQEFYVTLHKDYLVLDDNNNFKLMIEIVAEVINENKPNEYKKFLYIVKGSFK